MQANTYWADTAGLIYNLAFIFGGFIFYTVLYQSRLIPRWMAAWGLIAVVMLLGGALLGSFIEVTMVVELVFVLPIAVQEMVMAFWLIVKGWNPDAFEPIVRERDSERTDMTGTTQPTPA